MNETNTPTPQLQPEPTETELQHAVRTELHDLRIEADRLLKRIDNLRPAHRAAGRNLSIAFTCIEDARMRLGMALGDVGEQLPAGYPVDQAE